MPARKYVFANPKNTVPRINKNSRKKVRVVSWPRKCEGGFGQCLSARRHCLFVLFPERIGSHTDLLDGYFGQGILPSIGHCFLLLFAASFYALFYFAILSVMTGLLRRPRLGLVAIALIMLLLNAQTTALDFALTVLFVLVFLAVLVRIGLVAAAAFFFILRALRHNVGTLRSIRRSEFHKPGSESLCTLQTELRSDRFCTQNS